MKSFMFLLAIAIALCDPGPGCGAPAPRGLASPSAWTRPCGRFFGGTLTRWHGRKMTRAPWPIASRCAGCSSCCSAAPIRTARSRELLDEQQSSASPDYHQWLTPQQFGQQFGPADADIQTVTTG